MNTTPLRISTALLVLAASATSQAQDRADIDTTRIIGNRELPKVLTFVPWKKPLPGTLAGRPARSVLDDALTPIDREVLRRQIAYSSQVHAQLQNKATPPAAAPSAQPAGTTAESNNIPASNPAPANGEKR